MKLKVNIYVCEITKVYLLVDNQNGVCHVYKVGPVMFMPFFFVIIVKFCFLFITKFVPLFFLLLISFFLNAYKEYLKKY